MFSQKAFSEDFDSFDEEIWTMNKFTFGESGSTMTPKAIGLENSLLTISVDKNSIPGDPRKFQGGELGSKQFFGYGKYSVRMKNAIQSGTVSSFFLMNEWKEKNWEHKEIDIEFFGKDPTQVQFTVHHYAQGGKDHILYEHLHDLGFDSSNDFNEYGIEWKKGSIKWLINGKVVHTENRIVPDTLLQIRINHWSANDKYPWTSKWLGSMQEDLLPSRVQYDWIKFEPY